MNSTRLALDVLPLQASHIAHDMPMAPHSRLGDGLIDLFFIKKGASRIAMIQVSNFGKCQTSMRDDTRRDEHHLLREALVRYLCIFTLDLNRLP